MLDLNFYQVKQLLELFGNEDGVITLTDVYNNSGHGVYAHFKDYPEEGGVLLELNEDE